MSDKLRILSLGAGIQSTALYLMAEKWEVKPDVAIFADTGFEPHPVYKHLEKLKEIGSIPIEIVSEGNIKEETLDGVHSGKWFGNMPFFVSNQEGGVGMINRACTQHYKIKPIRKRIQELRLIHDVKKVEQWIGISTDESHRAKASNVKYIENRFPLLELGLSRIHCIAYLKSIGWGETPKSSCIGCPFHSDAFWIEMKNQRPEEFAEAIDFDNKIRKYCRVEGEAFLHRSGKPLSNVVFLHEYQNELFKFECEGMCGV
jgi:hypothetical protein